MSPTEPSTAGSAPRNVQWRPKAEEAPHNATVAIQAEMRFLRFQAPWASGRMVFVLLRNTLAENWANIRNQRMNVAKNRDVREALRDAGKAEMRNSCVKHIFSLH